MEKIKELVPYDSHKSFYKKAYIYRDENNNLFLKSYSTYVCCIDEDGVFHRFWDGESTTTSRHIAAFLQYAGIYSRSNCGGVRWWRSIYVEDLYEYLRTPKHKKILMTRSERIKKTA